MVIVDKQIEIMNFMKSFDVLVTEDCHHPTLFFEMAFSGLSGNVVSLHCDIVPNVEAVRNNVFKKENSLGLYEYLRKMNWSTVIKDTDIL